MTAILWWSSPGGARAFSAERRIPHSMLLLAAFPHPFALPPASNPTANILNSYGDAQYITCWIGIRITHIVSSIRSSGCLSNRSRKKKLSNFVETSRTHPRHQEQCEWRSVWQLLRTCTTAFPETSPLMEQMSHALQDRLSTDPALNNKTVDQIESLPRITP